VGFTLGRARVYLTDLQDNRAAPPGRIPSHRPALHSQCLLVIEGNARIQPRRKTDVTSYSQTASRIAAENSRSFGWIAMALVHPTDSSLQNTADSGLYWGRPIVAAAAF